MRVAVVPGVLALLPEYASLVDPVAEVRAAVQRAVAWLTEDGPVGMVLAATPAAERIAVQLLGDALGEGPGVLVVASGSATRSEKAPGHLDERAAGFDAAVGVALAAGDGAALTRIDTRLAGELWAMPDADVFAELGERAFEVTEATIDYDDAPYGVQYWVARWQCRGREVRDADPAR